MAYEKGRGGVPPWQFGQRTALGQVRAPVLGSTDGLGDEAAADTNGVFAELPDPDSL
jgi:hypothetical protein